MGHKVKKICKTRGETSDFSRLTFETNCYVKVQQKPKSFIEAHVMCCVLCIRYDIQCACLYTHTVYVLLRSDGIFCYIKVQSFKLSGDVRVFELKRNDEHKRK